MTILNPFLKLEFFNLHVLTSLQDPSSENLGWIWQIKPMCQSNDQNPITRCVFDLQLSSTPTSFQVKVINWSFWNFAMECAISPYKMVLTLNQTCTRSQKKYIYIKNLAAAKMNIHTDPNHRIKVSNFHPPFVSCIHPRVLAGTPSQFGYSIWISHLRGFVLNIINWILTRDQNE